METKRKTNRDGKRVPVYVPSENEVQEMEMPAGVATYTNLVTGEIYRLAGVRDLGHAWAVFKAVCQLNGWNPATFSSDVRVRFQEKKVMTTKNTTKNDSNRTKQS